MTKVLKYVILAAMFLPTSARAADLIETLTSATKWEGDWRTGARACWGTAVFTFEKNGSELKGRLAEGKFTNCYDYTGRSVEIGDITNVQINGNEISFNVPSGSLWEMEYDADDDELNGSGRTTSGRAFRGTFEPVR